jgi:hypothetical protein
MRLLLASPLLTLLACSTGVVVEVAAPDNAEGEGEGALGEGEGEGDGALGEGEGEGEGALGEGEGEGDGALGEGEGEGEGALGEGEGEGEGEGALGEGEGDGCEADACVSTFPTTIAGTTVGGSDVLEAYACGTQNESGPERVVQVSVPGAGVLEVVLDDSLEDDAVVDVDVHILRELGAAQCMSRGDRRAAVAVDAAGIYYVVLDSYVRANGSEGAGAFSAQFLFRADDGTSPAEAALVAAGAGVDVAALAVRAYNNARQQNITDRPELSVIDFSLPSTQRRLWVINMDTGTILFNDRVSHGSGSNSDNDPSMADTFSNTPGSNMTSLGLALTAETYQGNNGYSLRLDGLEDSNDNNRTRAIVVHGAQYAEDSFVDTNGYLGRSNGCPAVAMSRSAAFIDIIRDGSLLFHYAPDTSWIASSPFLQ